MRQEPTEVHVLARVLRATLHAVTAGAAADDPTLDAWGHDLGALLRRDGPSCVWCSTPFGRQVRPTREHVIPRVKGGPTWPENLVAACPRCNRERGTSSAVQWLDELRMRGRTPRPQVVTDALVALAGRIRRDGGARRARGPLQSELRKLGVDANLRG
jgi:hypothetical protein